MASYRYPTKDLSIQTAKAFIHSVTMRAGDISDEDGRDVKRSTILYAVIGHNKPWPDEPNPIPPEDNEQYHSYDSHRNFIGGRKINPQQVSHVTDRHDWVSGTVYAQYRDTDIDIYDRAFYVLTDEYNVYKCLYNNKGSASTVKPTGFSTVQFTTSDGYTWKYMYTISLAEANKFLTATHMPVKTISANDGSVESDRQVSVQNSAVNGSIDIIETVNIGTGYHTIDNGVVESGGKYRLRLSNSTDNPPSPIDNFYNGSTVYIASGTGAGQLRRIIDYEGSTKTLTVNTAFATTCNTDSKAIISPSVTIVGDGMGAKAYSRVDVSDGSISNVTIIAHGSGYTRAEALITSNTIHGAGATANCIISPTGGHGRDAVRELYADKVMLNVEFNGVEGVSANGNGYIPSNTEFRSITLLADPVLKCDANNNFTVTENVANTSNSPQTIRFTTRMTVAYENPAVEFNVGDILTTNYALEKAKTGELEFVTELGESQRNQNGMKNAKLAANGDIVYLRDDELQGDPSIKTFYINNVESYSNYAAFTKDSILLKYPSDTPLAVVESIKGPEANTFSGEVLYLENLQAVTRDPEQVEDIKIILDF